MIELSVAMPLFRAKYIGWLAFEGLCRQKDIDFEWELVVAEEVNDEPFIEENLGKYEERLKKAGCARMAYIPLEKWVPLSIKYRILANNCSEDSGIFATCAADLFPPPTRLRTQYEVFTKDPEVDWAANGRTIIYDIESEKYYLHDILEDRIQNDGSNRAIRMEMARNLPKTNLKKNVDGWVWRSIKNYVKLQNKNFKHYLDASDNWQYGLNVNGLNNISLRRKKKFNDKFIERSPRLKKCPIDINDTIPKDIMDRLRECKQYIRLHKKGLPKD